MVSSICGIDCTQCGFRDSCNGCEETDGRPFGADCIVALCCQKSNDALRELKERLIAQFNALGIDDMEEVKDLNALKGSFVNLAYPFLTGRWLSSGMTTEFIWEISFTKQIVTDVMELLQMRDILWCLNMARVVPKRK